MWLYCFYHLVIFYFKQTEQKQRFYSFFTDKPAVMFSVEVMSYRSRYHKSFQNWEVKFP